MKTKVILLIVFAGLSYLAYGQQQRHLNLVVVSDVSDRLIQPGQCDRDKKIINGIAEIVNANIRQNFRINSKAGFALKVPRQGGLIMPEAEEALFLDMRNVLPTQRALESNRFFEHLDENIEALFSYAYKGTETDSYFGCETIPLMISISTYYLKRDPAFQDVIVLISDGYIDFQDYKNVEIEVSKGRYTTTRFFNKLRSYRNLDLGIAPVDFSGSKVIICEVSPKYDRKFEELNMITNTWKKWGNESKAELLILTSDMPVERVVNEIRSFIR
jgi:hypothetical protein